MLALIICASLLAVTTDVVQAKYVYRPKIHGWIAQHKIIATWEEAFRHCRSEDYAMLASPITEELREEMTSLITGDTEYFIGTRAMYYTAPYVSVEGMPLEDTPAVNMIEKLDPREGQCLSISRLTIKTVPCTKRLPYMCYKKEESESREPTECGTTDPGYKFDFTSGTCFKVHQDAKSWPIAYATCVAEGAHLAVFNDDMGAHSIRNITFPTDVNSLFIGLHDREGNGDWLSIYGDRVEQLYNSWKEGKKPVSYLMRCGAILSSGMLDNYSCDSEKNFLCEKELTSTRFPAADLLQ